jgi:hypothetical protein
LNNRFSRIENELKVFEFQLKSINRNIKISAREIRNVENDVFKLKSSDTWCFSSTESVNELSSFNKIQRKLNLETIKKNCKKS